MFVVMLVKERFDALTQALNLIYDKEESIAIARQLFESYGLHMQAPAAMQQEFPVQFEQHLEQDTARLLAHEPLQYVTGKAWFYNMLFSVNKNVLIPRPETEELVHWLLTDHQGALEIQIVDLGTGSGCIPVKIKKELKKAVVKAIDVSEKALEIAKENAAMHQCEIDFFQLDMLDAGSFKLLGKTNIIISNPPYIPPSAKKTMERHVLEFEPELALFVPEDDPLLYYKAIVKIAGEILEPNGNVYMETHFDLAQDVAELFIGSNCTTEIRKDMSGNDRMVKATRSL